MTLEVRLRPDSERDLADAAVWYEEQRQGLGHEFLDEVLTMLSSIAATPLMHPNVHRNTRRAVIHRVPFGVYFRVEEATIVVVAVMHGSRNPRRWKNRT
ncbi:MAG: type II toxin-antitoxin system RelE/ParE family toxin [Nitrospirae bacterium]|nr:type II toxin-antitoxin system RelE/ParE family toxin [Nitrospirota bacterium]